MVKYDLIIIHEDLLSLEIPNNLVRGIFNQKDEVLAILKFHVTSKGNRHNGLMSSKDAMTLSPTLNR